MTVSATDPYVAYAGAGTSGPFAVPFKFLANDHLAFVLRSADGSEVPLTGMTITGAGDDDGGEAYTLAPVAAGETLVIVRDTPLTQLAQYVANGPFPAATHEGALDKGMLAIQDNARDTARALKVPLGEAGLVLPSLADRANKVLGFDGDSSAIALNAAGVLDGLASKLRGSLIATGGETEVVVSQAVAAGDEAFVELFIGGAQQEPQVDYVANGTATLTLNEALITDAEVRWVHTGGSAGFTSARPARQYGRGADAVYRQPDDKASDFASVLDYIPVIYHYGIWNRTNVTDLADYIEAALEAESALSFPAGKYKIGRSIGVSKSGLAVKGFDPLVTEIDLAFATGDGITFGNGADLFTYLSFSGFLISSSVTRLSGAAVKFDKIYVGAVHDVVFRDQVLGLELQTCINFPVDDISVISPTVGTGVGIRISGGNDQILRRIYCQADSGSAGLTGVDVQYSAAIWMTDVEVINYAGGIDLHPREAGDYIDWVFMADCAGDTCTDFGIRIKITGDAIHVVGVHMLGCWGSTSEVGLLIDKAVGATGFIDGVSVDGFRALTNRKEGIKIASGAIKNVQISNPTIAGNGALTPNTYDGIYVAAGVSGFQCIGGSIGLHANLAASQRYGIYFAAGATDVVSVIGTNVSNNMTAGLFPGATGPNVTVVNCPGYLAKNGGLATLLSGATTKVVAHGLAATPNHIFIEPRADVGGRTWVDTIGATNFTIHTSAAPGADVAIGWQASIYAQG